MNIINKMMKSALANLKHRVRHMIKKIVACLKWIGLAVLTGVAVGAFSTAFAWCLLNVTALRGVFPWLLFLLPAGGLVIVLLYRASGLKKDPGTNLVLSSISDKDRLPGRMSVLIFISTVITHLFGGSAGREGAALQMGGSLGHMMGKLFKMDERHKKVMIMCGMSAAFSAVFGTPMAAAVFSMEVISVGIMHYSALVPCMFSSLVASRFAAQMGIAPASFTIIDIPDLSIESSLKICLLALCCAVLSIVLCSALHTSSRLYQKFIKNQYIRIFVGGCIVIVLTLICQTGDYNGAGTEVIARAMTGETVPAAFILKIVFTAVTLGAGFKGGEIVPSFFVGATFGCLFGQILGISPSLCAAAGMAATFCGVTNCPLTTLLISFELFGFSAIPYFMIAIPVSYILSGYRGLYRDQIIVYSKYRPQFIHRLSGDESEDDVVQEEESNKRVDFTNEK
jgi:H+/Cl- antiporter ClcA